MNKVKKPFSPKSVFILLLFFSLLTLFLMLFPDIGTILGPNILFLWGLLILSGVALIIVTFNEGINRGKLKIFLLTAGFSAAGFVVGVVLHNMFYALGTLFTDLPILSMTLNVLEAGSLLIAVVLCPIGLLVGLVGTILMWRYF